MLTPQEAAERLIKIERDIKGLTDTVDRTNPEPQQLKEHSRELEELTKVRDILVEASKEAQGPKDPRSHAEQRADLKWDLAMAHVAVENSKDSVQGVVALAKLEALEQRLSALEKMAGKSSETSHPGREAKDPFGGSSTGGKGWDDNWTRNKGFTTGQDRNGQAGWKASFGDASNGSSWHLSRRGVEMTDHRTRENFIPGSKHKTTTRHNLDGGKTVIEADIQGGSINAKGAVFNKSGEKTGQWEQITHRLGGWSRTNRKEKVGDVVKLTRISKSGLPFSGDPKMITTYVHADGQTRTETGKLHKVTLSDVIMGKYGLKDRGQTKFVKTEPDKTGHDQRLADKHHSTGFQRFAKLCYGITGHKIDEPKGMTHRQHFDSLMEQQRRTDPSQALRQALAKGEAKANIGLGGSVKSAHQDLETSIAAKGAAKTNSVQHGASAGSGKPTRSIAPENISSFTKSQNTLNRSGASENRKRPEGESAEAFKNVPKAGTIGMSGKDAATGGVATEKDGKVAQRAPDDVSKIIKEAEGANRKNKTGEVMTGQEQSDLKKEIAGMSFTEKIARIKEVDSQVLKLGNLDAGGRKSEAEKIGDVSINLERLGIERGELKSSIVREYKTGMSTKTVQGKIETLEASLASGKAQVNNHQPDKQADGNLSAQTGLERNVGDIVKDLKTVESMEGKPSGLGEAVKAVGMAVEQLIGQEHRQEVSPSPTGGLKAMVNELVNPNATEAVAKTGSEPALKSESVSRPEVESRAPETQSPGLDL